MGLQHKICLYHRWIIENNTKRKPRFCLGFFYFAGVKNKAEVSIIVAIGNDNAIGKDNQLLWSIKDDLRLFLKMTSGHVVIHGRKSFESIGKPLANRTNIIITRDRSYSYPGCFVVHSLEEAIELGQRLEQKGELFILGGAQVYDQCLVNNLIDKLYISHVDGEFPHADAYFPNVDLDKWKVESYSSFDQNDENEYGFEFAIYTR